MNFLFLSPNFPPHYWMFCRRLKETGVNVLGIGETHDHDMRPELRDALSGYYRVQSLSDFEQVFRAAAWLIHGHGRIDRFESLNEHWLETDAAIRAEFNIRGPRPNQMEMFKRKSKMKSGFATAGVPTARYELAHNLPEALQAAQRIGLPVVIKPDKGVGASSTFRADSARDLEDFFRAHPNPTEFIVEEFIDGRIVTFDGLADQDGKVVFYTSHEYSHGVMDIVNFRLNHYYHSVRVVPEDIDRIGHRCVEAFNVRESFFHFEFFRCPDNRLVAIELNKRPPGGPTLDMMNYANDFDIYREYANVVAHNRFEATYDRPYFCCYAGRRLDRAYAHSHQDIMTAWGHLIVHHEAIDPLSRVAMCDYGYIFRSPQREEIERVAAFIHAPGVEDLGWVGHL